MLTLIEYGEVYTPDPVGKPSILLTDGKIARVGEVDRRAVDALGVECEVIDATGCLVVPGLIDPHQHLPGGSGERGFGSQTPEFFIGEIVRWGITTVERVLSLVTRNPARILKLHDKGVLEKGRMDVVHVLSRGVFMVRGGALVVKEGFLEGSNREIHLRGDELGDEGR